MKISSQRHLRRRENLALLIKEAGGASQLAALVETPKSHVSALLSGNRGIGDALAAKLESVFEKAPGWLDADQTKSGDLREPGQVSTVDQDERDVLLSFRRFPPEVKRELARDFMRLALQNRGAAVVEAIRRLDSDAPPSIRGAVILGDKDRLIDRVIQEPPPRRAVEVKRR